MKYLDNTGCKYTRDLFYESKYLKTICVSQTEQGFNDSQHLCETHGMSIFKVDSAFVRNSLFDFIETHYGSSHLQAWIAQYDGSLCSNVYSCEKEVQIQSRCLERIHSLCEYSSPTSESKNTVK